MAYASRALPAPPQPYSSPVLAAPSYPVAAPRAAAAAPPHQPTPTVNVPPGTLPPGTVVNVGEYQVVVERFLSEGGFAHVYLANSSVPLPRGSPTATTKHVLKRMAVPDTQGVEEVGREVEVMRQLKNHPKIVNMIEASVADLPGGVDGSKGYEIYILMEWCPGGGIIDMMNTRLQNRLTESEILKIFADTVEAVAHMHYQSPPLIHRDLKVENILLTPPQTYKLCDFGSTTKPLPREKVPTAVEGIQKIEMEINRTTTLQYRAPELVDVWGRKGFDEKIDIWALGVLLYKLCYYTTPFEEHGPLAILNAQYKFPPYPAYSPSIRSLIAAMLQERASARPNIYQVHEMVCRLRGVAVRLENKYALTPSATGASLSRTHSLTALSRTGAPSSPTPGSPLSNILSTTSPALGAPSSPGAALGLQGLAETVAPMRRGRPSKGPAVGARVGVEARQVRTGLATVGAEGPHEGQGRGRDGGGDGSAWKSFGGREGETPIVGSTLPAFGATVGGGGFGDAFAPPSSLPAVSKAPDIPLETSVEMPSNMAMFAELVPPPPAGKERASSPMDLLRRQKDKAQAQQKQDEIDAERRRFESTFPPLEDELVGFPAPLPEVTPTALSPVPPPVSAMPSQLTGETGPPLPRRPPAVSSPTVLSPLSSPAPPSAPALPAPVSAAKKPELVSRYSQTSPQLMASWRNGSSATTSFATFGPKSASTSTNGTSSGLRQSSIPQLELSQPSPSPEPPTSTNEKVKAPSFDLLGDEDEFNTDAFAPRPLSSASRSPALPASPVQQIASSPPALRSPEQSEPAPAPSPSSSLSGNVASKRMSFLGSPTISIAGLGGEEKKEREKFRPTRRSSVGLTLGMGIGNEGKEGQGGGVVRKGEEERREEERKKVEERFPPLPEEASQLPGKNGAEQWEQLVEKEEADDSSDDELAPELAPAPATVNKPAFEADDEDDFAPRAVPRPKFGAAASSAAGSLSVATSQLTLSTSPSPLNSTYTSPAPAPLTAASRTTSSSSEDGGGGGGIDLDPALASIRKFAPEGNSAPPTPSLDSFAPPSSASFTPPASSSTTTAASPSQSKPPISRSPPLLAPKPQYSSRKTAINSLVSRYEGLGTSLTGGPPPVGSKPVGLRKDSTGSSDAPARDAVKPKQLPQWSAGSGVRAGTAATPHWASHAASPEAVGQRFPAPPTALEQHLASRSPPLPSSSISSPPPPLVVPPPSSSSSNSTPTASSSFVPPTTTRVPFKPVPPPPGSPSSSSSRAGGAGMGGGGVTAPPPTKQEAEQEERFAGVSSMKSRWESMAASSSTKAGEGPQAGGARGRGAARKEWAAI
ncbi:hypothetical protein JCM1840_006999 [Sporobolomyces johnsonii]